MWEEFKKFAVKGNVIDLAIAVIVGGAFGKIVTSLVNDVIMPVFGIVFGGVDFSGLVFTYKDAAISYGLFLQSIVDFFLISVSIFLFVRLFERFKKKEETEAPAPEPASEVVLLTEIRDLLQQKTN